MTVRVWDVNLGKQIQGPLKGHKSRVFFVAFSPDGKIIISASKGGNVCAWDTDTGALMSGPSQRHMTGTIAVAFTPSSLSYAVSPDGNWIAGHSTNDSNTVHVWNSQTGRLAASIGAHIDDVRSVSFSADSKRILSTSYDRTICIHILN